MAFPSPPWTLSGRMWLSVFRVPADEGGDPRHPAGLYGAAFVSYEPPGVLTYRELLVARLDDALRRRCRITDIWVDSEASLEGGRVLWAIPKESAEFELAEARTGPLARATFSARVHGSTVAAARFASAPGLALARTPFAGAVSQQREDATAGEPVVTPWRGSARVVVARGSWEVDPAGPLGYLHGRRPLASFRLSGIRLRFG